MMTIRFAKLSDARSIALVHVISWQTIYRAIIPDTILNELSVDDREKLWMSLLNKDVKVLVLEEKDRIIGFVSFGPCRDNDIDSSIASEITAIYLHPEKWGKGFGKLLLNAAITEIKNGGYKKIYLWVIENNIQARNFYEHLDFSRSNDIKIEKENGYTLQEIRYYKIIE